jgi:hypothetical protein
MMMPFPLLNSAALIGAANMYSPSKNVCLVRVPSQAGTASRFRHDPYRASVLPPIVPSPVKELPRTLAPLRPVAPRVAAAVVPAAAASKPSQTLYVCVRFKHASAFYTASFDVAEGEQVMVEGDRGENIGVVAEVKTQAPSFPVPCKVVRRADSKDRDALVALRRKEAITTRHVGELAEDLAPGMRIVDTEFQFDGNKLTVYFASRGAVDFRKLQRALFKEFRCRIWLVNWNEVQQ